MSELPRPDGNQSNGELYESFTPDAVEQDSPSTEEERHEVPQTNTEVAFELLGKEVDGIKDQLDGISPQRIRTKDYQRGESAMDVFDGRDQGKQSPA
jgi:hypothetical protein